MWYCTQSFQDHEQTLSSSISVFLFVFLPVPVFLCICESIQNMSGFNMRTGLTKPYCPLPAFCFIVSVACQDVLLECHLMKPYLNLLPALCIDRERRYQLIERKRSQWFIINKHVGYSKHNTQCNSPRERQKVERNWEGGGGGGKKKMCVDLSLGGWAESLWLTGAV